jgi:hypothetical protein
LSSTDFVIVLPPSNLSALSEKIRIRLEQSLEYFYPIKDREQMAKSRNRLNVKLSEISSLKDNFGDISQVKIELARLKS